MSGLICEGGDVLYAFKCNENSFFSSFGKKNGFLKFGEMLELIFFVSVEALFKCSFDLDFLTL